MVNMNFRVKVILNHVPFHISFKREAVIHPRGMQLVEDG